MCESCQEGVSDVESPFEESLGVLETVFKKNGFSEAINDVTELKRHLRAITAKEFETHERGIKKRLDLTLRARYVPSSIISSLELLGDQQFEEAWRIANDDSKYETLVAGPQDERGGGRTRNVAASEPNGGAGKATTKRPFNVAGDPPSRLLR